MADAIFPRNFRPSKPDGRSGAKKLTTGQMMRFAMIASPLVHALRLGDRNRANAASTSVVGVDIQSSFANSNDLRETDTLSLS